MAEKKIKTRIQQKVDTKANWDKATNFIPLKGEYIYYSDTHRVKVGDGVTKLSALSYLADDNTNTHYTTGLYIGAADAKSNAATTNGNTHLKAFDDNTKRAQFVIKGSGATSVSSDASGNITISSTDTNTHQSVTDKNPTLAWSTKSTVANIGGTDIHVTMPANPNTDTHFTTGLYVGKADEKSNSATTNGNTYLKLYDNDTKRAQHLINGGGATTITSNTSGSITVSTSIRNLDTTSSSGLSAGSENIAGSGTVYLHKVAKTGSYNDLQNKPTIPTKLTDLSDRSFNNITSRGEGYLEWGGPAQKGSLSPLGVALSEAHSVNQLAFINEKALTFEYSSDGGLTWTPYPSSIGNKSVFCTMTDGISLPIGRPDNSTDLIANKSKTRITITALDGQNAYLFAKIKKMLIYVSTAATISLLVETRTGTNYNNGAWDTVGTYSLGGWSGWNDIPLQITLGGFVGQTTNNYQLRLTASYPTVSSADPKEGKLLSLKLFGDTCWIPANTSGTEGKLYAFDINKNVTFPAFVSASSFLEGGTALSNKYLDKGTSSTVVNQVVYNPVEMKKALTVPSLQSGLFGPSGSYGTAFSLGSTTINGNTAAQLILSSPGLGSTTITQNSAVFAIQGSSKLSCDPDGWKIDNSPVVTSGNIEQYMPNTQTWKLTSTTGTVTNVNVYVH